MSASARFTKRVLDPGSWSVRTLVTLYLSLGILSVAGCAPQPAAPGPIPTVDTRAEAADCIVRTTGEYVSEYGDMSAAVWVSIYDHCTEEAGL